MGTQEPPSKTQSKHWWVAYSGGLDSHVLLDVVHNISLLQPEYKIGAVHVHHGLSPNADAWVKHCESVAATLQIPFRVLWVDATVTDGQSPEEVAREARIEAWEHF